MATCCTDHSRSMDGKIRPLQYLQRGWLKYEHMSPRRLTYVTGNLFFVIFINIYKSSIVKDFHCSFIDVGRLRRTRMLVVLGLKNDEFKFKTRQTHASSSILT